MSCIKVASVRNAKLSLLIFLFVYVGAKFRELPLAQGENEKKTKVRVSEKSGVAENMFPYESSDGGWRKLHIEECHNLYP